MHISNSKGVGWQNQGEGCGTGSRVASHNRVPSPACETVGCVTSPGHLEVIGSRWWVVAVVLEGPGYQTDIYVDKSVMRRLEMMAQ